MHFSNKFKCSLINNKSMFKMSLNSVLVKSIKNAILVLTCQLNLDLKAMSV